MIKQLLFLFCILLSFQTSFAQCSEQEENRVMLIGDSWAFFMGVDGTLSNVFEAWGHNNVKFYTNIEIAVNGARTTDFLESGMQTEIQDVINSNPEIDVVHLSIAGNDVLGQWNVNFTQTELDDLINEVYGQTDSIIRFLKTIKPGIKIVFSGYVYPNFEEVLVDDNPLGSSHPFYGTWEDMGFPSFLEINTILNDFSVLIEDYANADPQVEFFKVPGLLQYTFGQSTPLAIAPGGSYPPFTQPLPFGDPSYPSPQNSMRDYFGITRDCFHLSPKGYRDLIGYHTQKFYHKHFMDDQVLYANNNNNGSVSSLQTISTDLMLGLDAGEEFGAIMDFNTTDMNWDGVVGAELFMQIKEISGDNPLSAPLELSLVSGNLGASASVEAGDWTASVDESATPCVFGNINNVNQWVRIKIPGDLLPFIQDNANTQFRLKSTSSAQGMVEFNNTSDPEFAPVLNLKYDENFVSIRESLSQELIKLFPNPANDYIHLLSPERKITKVQIYNALGQMMLESGSDSRIFIGDLPEGFYQLVIQVNDEFVVKSLVKK